jgi:hypothetical protein
MDRVVQHVDREETQETSARRFDGERGFFGSRRGE